MQAVAGVHAGLFEDWQVLFDQQSSNAHLKLVAEREEKYQLEREVPENFESVPCLDGSVGRKAFVKQFLKSRCCTWVRMPVERSTCLGI